MLLIESGRDSADAGWCGSAAQSLGDFVGKEKKSDIKPIYMEDDEGFSEPWNPVSESSKEPPAR